MITKRPAYAAAAALTIAATAFAQTPSAPPSFRFERPIVIAGDGPRRLPIDVTLLSGATPFRIASRARDPRTQDWVVEVADGVRDLRLYDGGGREVGYLLVGNPPPVPSYRPAAILAVAPIDTDTLKSSGFEADLGEVLTVDRFRIEGLPAPFLKRVRLEGSGDRQRWTLLVGEGTLFDLPDEQLRLTELRFVPGAYRYIRVTWDDTNSARLPRPPAATAGTLLSAAPVVPLTAPLAFERQSSEPGVSRFRVRLPAGRLPIVALDLDVAGGHLLRQANVYEARLNGSQLAPVALGSATLRRVVRDNLTAADLQIPIIPPTDSVLDLVVNDGDNQPLELLGVTAVFATLPWIYLEAPAGTLTARYGNSALTAPRYDLEAVRTQINIAAVADAVWGEARPRSPEENAAGSIPPLPTVGAPLDVGLFTFVRPIPQSAAGLIAVHVDEAVLAHSDSLHGRFSDVRIIDAEGRQVPYVLEHASGPLSLDAVVDRVATPPAALTSTSGARSVYRVKYPHTRLPASRLVLTTSSRVFERVVRVVIEREPDAHRRDPWIETVAQATWAHAVQETLAAPLTLQIPTVAATDLLVVVEEGDNSPLPVESARILLPRYRLRLFSNNAAALRLAYGRTDLAPPQYDLALLTPQVLGAVATDVTPGAEAPMATATAAAALVSPTIFWVVLGAAVIVLLILIVRLLS
jgi:hypothetical protein